MFQLSTPDVTTQREEVGPQMNKFQQVPSAHHQGFEQVPSDYHQGRRLVSMSDVGVGVERYPTMWPIPWCIWCYLPPPLWAEWLMDRYLWKYYLPQLRLRSVIRRLWRFKWPVIAVKSVACPISFVSEKGHKQCMVQKLTLFEKQSVQDETSSTFLYHLVLLFITFKMNKEAK